MKDDRNLPPRLRPRKDEARRMKQPKPPRAAGVPSAESRVRYAGTSRPQR